MVEMEYSDWKYNDPKHYPYNWMVNDLWKGIQTESNYLVCLGLFAYSEALGWLIGGEKENEKTWVSFKRFTEKYLPDCILSQEKHWEDYNSIRNGLTHRYFIKKRDSGVFIGKIENKAIEIVGEKIHVNVLPYFKDFVVGLEQFINETSVKDGPTGPKPTEGLNFSTTGATGSSGPLGISETKLEDPTKI